MKLYAASACDQVIDKYIEAGGIIESIEEGVLGYGLVILFGEGLKTTIIKEIYINEWSSAHTIRSYNQTPKKYQAILSELGY